jgi:hypothetical protein
LSNLIMEMLAKKPKDRPADAREVWQRLMVMESTEISNPRIQLAPLTLPPFAEPLSDAKPAMPAGHWKAWFLTVLIAASIFFLAREIRRPDLGSLHISSDYPAVELEILQNGDRVATTFFQRHLQVPPGTYSVRLMHRETRYRVSPEVFEITKDTETLIRVLPREP